MVSPTSGAIRFDNLVPPAGKHFVEIGEMRMSRDNGSKSLPLDQWKDPLIIWTCECPLNILLTRVDYFEDERLDVLQAIIDGVLKSVWLHASFCTNNRGRD